MILFWTNRFLYNKGITRVCEGTPMPERGEEGLCPIRKTGLKTESISVRLVSVEPAQRGIIPNMADKRRKTALKDNSGSLSLLVTLHAISRMSRDEFELLKKLRETRETGICLNEDQNRILQHILESFNVETIQEVITVVDQFKLYELYDL